MKARVHVRLKPSVLDPQGKAILNALTALGFTGIREVRQGKLIELDLADTDLTTARARVKAMAAQLLANPVIEDFTIDLAAEEPHL
jgi:phosphoribosylformylglycinamidine synthase PurS subunit